MDLFCGTPLWDSNIWLKEGTDLTPCFHSTVLLWIPCGLLLILTPLDLFLHRRRPVNGIPWNVLSATKVIFTTLLIAISGYDLLVAIQEAIRHGQDVFPVQFVSPVIVIATLALSIYLLLQHRRKGIRSSGVLFVFWAVFFNASIPQLRSVFRGISEKRNAVDVLQHLFRRLHPNDMHLLQIGCRFVMLLLNCVSDQRPVNFVPPPNGSPEVGATFWRKMIFQWFDAFIWRGVRQPIDASTVWELNSSDMTETLNETFDVVWKMRLQQIHDGLKRSPSAVSQLVKALYQTVGHPVWITAIIRLVIIGLSLTSPQILGIIVQFMSSDETLHKGVVFSVLLFVISLLSTIMNTQTSFRLYRMGIQCKGILSSAIYRKSLNMSFSSQCHSSNTGELINLMSVDTFRCYNSMSNLHVIWEGPLLLIGSLYVLYTRLGIAAFSTLLVLGICAPLNLYVTKKLYGSQSAQMGQKDQRIKLMNEILNGIKILKLYAWEKCFQKNVENVREKEIHQLKKVATFSSISYMIWTMSPFLVTFVVFSVYLLLDTTRTLEPQLVFVVISTISVLCNAITNFNLGFIALSQMWVSLKRIAEFLACTEIPDNNVQSESSAMALTICGASFNWHGEKVILKNVNLEVPKGSLTAVVGPVGCGKSSLISALLGEMEKRSGSVNVDGSVAYAAQQAWMQNATLQENVLFGKPMNREWYREVIYACALKQDIEVLPGGDQTEIGEKGLNLSGGQKQRIALARAVYANADIYLLDDPLSAVDAHVGKHIFDNVIGPNGLLAGKTRLLVTHAISILPKLDTICVLMRGRICEQGSYQELMIGGEFSEFLLKHISEMTDEDQLDQIREVLNDEMEGRVMFERAMSIRSTTTASTLPRRPRIIPQENEVAKKNSSTGKLIEKESSGAGDVGWRVYSKYIDKIGPVMAVCSFLLIFLTEVFSVQGNLWIAKWSSDEHSEAKQSFYLLIYGLFGFARVVSMFCGALLFSWAALNGARRMHNDLLHTIIRLPMSFFDTTPLGRIMNRFSSDIDIVDFYLPTAVRLGAMFFSNVCGVVVVIGLSNSKFIWIIVAFSVMAYCILKIYIITSRQLKRVESVTLSPIYSHFSETLAGLPTIRAFRKQQEFTQTNCEKINCNQKCTYAELVANRWLFCRLELIGSLIVLLVAMFAVYNRSSEANPATVGLSITYALNATMVLSYFVRMFADIETSIVAVERIDEYTRLPREKEDGQVEISEKWPSQGRVCVEKLKLKYRPGLDSIIKGITFTIHPGQKIGIVGRTGAGKSSLTLALFRLIEAAGGQILIDNQDIASLDLETLRSRLTIIPQEPILFSGSLRMNLDPHHQYSDDAIWNALELSHLKAFVGAQSQGLLHTITEGGDNLSIGQRQLICLARAILRKTKILIMDEATAAVDLETDELIQNTIRTEFFDCTVLTIAHRLNTILDSDKICVLEDGEIVEFDSPSVLLNDSVSKFYSMAWDSGITKSDLGLKTKL